MDFLGIILASIIFMNFGICVKNEGLLHRSKSLINFYLENTIIFHSRPIFFYCAEDMNVAKNHQELFFFSLRFVCPLEWKPVHLSNHSGHSSFI